MEASTADQVQDLAAAARFFLKGWVLRMGKRAECRPDISGKVLDLVAEARAALGKAPQPKPASRPLATPVRSEAAAPSPMSMQSTPMRSPDLKRMKHVEEASQTQSVVNEMSNAVPPLPSFAASSPNSSALRNPDSCTTLGLSELAKLSLGGLVGVFK